MTRHVLLIRILLALVLVSPSLLAAEQATTPPGPAPQAPAGGRGGGRGAALKSPEIAADGRVTFRLRAPNAKEVVVSLGQTRLPMQKDEQGVWTATSDTLAPNYYTYSFVIDGTTVSDSANRRMETSFGSARSMFVIPGPEPWLPDPAVPRGAIARHTFRSAIAKDERDFLVYTPAGYEPKRSRAYPTLYLLHGLGDDAERWMNGGGANVILDNLIAQGKAVPMVVVTTLGYGVNNGPAGASTPESIPDYTKILLTEVMPVVEKTYNVATGRDQRAIAGLSMGGAEALFTGLNHLDKFAWIGSFSGAFVMWRSAAGVDGNAGRGAAPSNSTPVFEKTFPSLDTKANSSLRMLWITCGTADGLIGVNREFKDWLRSKGVRFTEEEVPDMGHVWPLWRRNLVDFAQKAFQK
ncbi:MAG TPA: alpha/beta hydrolase-fold protein [Vicinamibacterales bacterium]|nr:alpha/beta hydrolase-fold protein [Vicinamibacterales bacterium]